MKGRNISFHYTIGPFVIKTSQSVQLLRDILDTMKFQRTKKINYDPKGIMVARKKAANSHAFIHQEVVVLSDKANLEVISLEQPLVCVIEQSQEAPGHSEAQEQSQETQVTS